MTRSDRTRYGRVLERPQFSRSLAGRARRRRQTRAVVVTLSIVAAVVVVAAVARGMMRPADKTPPLPRHTRITAQPKDASTGTAESVAATPAAQPATKTAAASELASTVIEIGWVGDTTPGSRYGNPPDNGRALFTRVREFTVAPDIMVGNLEGTFGQGGPSKCDRKSATECYAFQAPPKNAEALAWAGFDVVNLANNHSNDYFDTGRTATRDALESNGIALTGLNGTMAVKEVDGVKVAFLGFAPYPWADSLADIEGARALVRAANEKADVVVVLIHAGAEGVDKTHTPEGPETAYGEFRGDSRAFAHAVVDEGADLVLGSGPHVVRGMEQYQGKLIAYSLGNFAGWKCFNRAGDRALSGILTVKVAGDGTVQSGRWRSMRIEDPGFPRPDTSREAVKLVQKLSDEDFATPVKMAEDGSFTMGTP